MSTSQPDPAETEANGAATEAQAVTISADEWASLQKLAAERDQFVDLLKRTQAEFENYQKRNSREREQDRRYIARGIISEMLPILDNLERATAAAKQSGDTGALIQGVLMVQTQFLDSLKRHGAQPIEALGKPFDPNQHEAVTQQPSDKHPANTVLQVLERGFTLNDQVLRPAKVIVSTAAK